MNWSIIRFSLAWSKRLCVVWCTPLHCVRDTHLPTYGRDHSRQSGQILVSNMRGRRVTNSPGVYSPIQNIIIQPNIPIYWMWLCFTDSYCILRTPPSWSPHPSTRGVCNIKVPIHTIPCLSNCWCFVVCVMSCSYQTISRPYVWTSSSTVSELSKS